MESFRLRVEVLSIVSSSGAANVPGVNRVLGVLDGLVLVVNSYVPLGDGRHHVDGTTSTRLRPTICPVDFRGIVVIMIFISALGSPRRLAVRDGIPDQKTRPSWLRASRNMSLRPSSENG